MSKTKSRKTKKRKITSYEHCLFKSTFSCSGKRHEVVISRNGHIGIPHTKENIRSEEIVQGLGGDPCPCIDILLSWRKGNKHKLKRYNMLSVYELFLHNREGMRIFKRRINKLNSPKVKLNLEKDPTAANIYDVIEKTIKDCDIPIRFNRTTNGLSSNNAYPKTIDFKDYNKDTTGTAAYLSNGYMSRIDQSVSVYSDIHNEANGLLYMYCSPVSVSRGAKNFPVWLAIYALGTVYCEAMHQRYKGQYDIRLKREGTNLSRGITFNPTGNMTNTYMDKNSGTISFTFNCNDPTLTKSLLSASIRNLKKLDNYRDMRLKKNESTPNSTVEEIL